jgi:hypothetical protein
MVRVGRWLAAAGAWLLAVALVAGVAWFAIDSAGHEVGADGAIALVVASAPSSRAAAAPAPAGPTSVTSPGSHPASLPASTTVAPSGTPAPTLATTARDVAPGSSTSLATPSRSTSRATGGTGGTGIPRPTAWPSDPGDNRAGIYSSPGGDLVVRCAGAKVEAWLLRPADGWREVAAPGLRGGLDAVFTPTEGPVLKVYAFCRDGNPAFFPGGRQARR